MTNSRNSSGSQTTVLVACTVGNALSVTPMVYSVFGLFLIPISLEFDWARSAVSLVLLILALVGAVSYPIVGRMIDRFGARRVIIIGLILFAISVAMVSGVTANRWHYYLTYALLGITAAIPSSVMYTKVIAGWFDSKRGFALGVAGGVGNGVGAAVAPIIVAILIANYGWRGAHQGIALMIVAIGLPTLLLWLRDPPQRRLSENSAAAGVTLSQASKTRTFWIILVAVALGAGCMTAVFSHVVPVLVDRNISMNNAVSILVTFSITTAIWQVCVGYVFDRFPRPWIAAPFYIAAIVGLFLLGTSSNYSTLLLSGVLMGLGLGTEYGVLPYFLSRYFGIRHYGAISGMIYGVVVLAQGVSPFLMDLDYDINGDYRIALIVIAVAVFIGAFLMTRLPTLPKLETSGPFRTIR